MVESDQITTTPYTAQDVPTAGEEKPTLAQKIGSGVKALAFCLVGGALFMWVMATMQVHRRMSRLRDLGQPTSISELNDKGLPPDRADTTDVWTRANPEPNRVTEWNWQRRLAALNGGSDNFPLPETSWPQRECVELLLSEVKDRREALQEAIASGGFSKWAIDEQGNNPTISRMRDMTNLLRVEAHVAAHKRDFQHVMECIRGQFAIVRAMTHASGSNGPWTRYGCLSITLDTIARLTPHSALSDDQLAELQQTVLSFDARESLHRMLVSGRAISLSDLDGALIGGLRIVRPQTQDGLLDAYDDLLALESQPWPEMLANAKSLEAEARKRGAGFIGMARYGMGPVMGPGSHLVGASVRMVARQRCVIISLAMQRQSLAHQKLPPQLAAIDPEFLPASVEESNLFVDPFSGEPIRVREKDGNLLVYALGLDQQDDLGDVELYDENGGLRAAKDVGFKVPLDW